MSSFHVKKAAVVGAGTMGGEIASVIASVGIPVLLKDVDQVHVDAGIEKARSVWQRQVDKEKLTPEQMQANLDLIEGTLTYDDFGDVDFVVEAVPERIEIKRAVFAELDAVTPGHAILATNTSALSIDEIAEATTRPQQVVGFHFFYPASFSRMLEVVAGISTAPETVAATYNFGGRIRKAPIICRDAPGFVVNRVLCASLGEMFKHADEQGLTPQQLDKAVESTKTSPLGPCALTDRLGLDTVLHVMTFLNEELGDTFYVPKILQDKVAAGELGNKTGSGFYPAGQSVADAAEEVTVDEGVAGQLVMRAGLRTLVECCRVVEEGIGGVRETDLGMALGAGVAPGPFVRADAAGLDVTLQAVEWAHGEWGEAFAPPVLLRRLVAQGRLGKKSGQGFYPYPQLEEGDQGEAVKLETRGAVAIAWLDKQPVNPLSPAVLDDLKAIHERVEADDAIRVLVIASASNAVFSAGADLKAFTQMSREDIPGFIADTHALMRSFETGRTVTIAAVNGAALGGGCELALACDMRIAAESASFGLPEITLGIIPGFGGTQRLKRITAAPKALDMMLSGEAINAWEAQQYDLVTEVVADDQLFDTAIALAERIAAQAPRAVQQIKQLADDPTLDADLKREQDAFIEVFTSADAVEGITAFLQKRAPNFTGE